MYIDEVSSKIDFPKLLGLGGVATSGKDTLYSKLGSKIEEELNIPCVRIALADYLKEDIDDFLKTSTGISAFTSSQEEKKVIRPLLVSYANLMRKLKGRDYWVRLAISEILDHMEEGHIVFVTDVRFPEELNVIKKLGGLLLHVSRLESGKAVEPACQEEKFYNPVLKEAADLFILWDTFKKDNDFEIHIDKVFNKLKTYDKI